MKKKFHSFSFAWWTFFPFHFHLRSLVCLPIMRSIPIRSIICRRPFHVLFMRKYFEMFLLSFAFRYWPESKCFLRRPNISLAVCLYVRTLVNNIKDRGICAECVYEGEKMWVSIKRHVKYAAAIDCLRFFTPTHSTITGRWIGERGYT